MLYDMFQKMLNLTRTIAKQGVRTFSHATWVSGALFHNNLYPLYLGDKRVNIKMSEVFLRSCQQLNVGPLY